jgi:hypothetical protein
VVLCWAGPAQTFCWAADWAASVDAPRGLASKLLDDAVASAWALGVDAALRKVDENRERLSVQARLKTQHFWLY